jgi:predicted nucleic acid-binding protein
MTTSIDSNVIAALWHPSHISNRDAVRVLGRARARGKLVVCAPVYSELMAGPLRDEASLDLFFSETGIAVDWVIEEEIWRESGKAYRGFAHRRKRSGGDVPRRILADFVIGAHALVRGCSLLTLDGKHYKAAFPTLPVLLA